MNDVSSIFIIILAVTVNVFAITYEKEVNNRSKKMEVIVNEMQDTIDYIFVEGLEITDRLNKCKREKR